MVDITSRLLPIVACVLEHLSFLCSDYKDDRDRQAENFS